MTTWINWNLNSTTCATTSQLWQYWVDSTTTATAASTTWQTNNNYIWQIWSDSGGTCSVSVPVAQVEEAEGLRYLQGVHDEHMRRIVDAEKRAKEAEARAEALLLECLSLRQLQEYKEKGSFIVHGRHARYRLGSGRSSRVDVINRNGVIQHRLCVHPEISVPLHDALLTQKLMLENDEDLILSKANIHPALQSNERVLEPLH